MNEFEPVRQSFLSWIFTALGFPYVILLTLAALLSFAVALIVVVRGRGPMATAALVLVVPMPLLVGLFGAIQGAISSYTVIAMSSTSPKPSDMAAGISTALVAAMVGVAFTAPGYAVATIGAVLRSVLSTAKATGEIHDRLSR